MRVLVACEFSGTVRNAFAARGHFARSVDLLPTESHPEPVRFRGDFGCMEHASYDPTCEACEHDEPWCHRCDAYAYECACLGPTEDEAEYLPTCEHGARHLSGDLFTVDDIDTDYARLCDEGVDIVTPIETEPWGERYFQMADPNGIIYQLVQWVEPLDPTH